MDDETAEFDSFLQPQEPPNSIEKCKTGAQKKKKIQKKLCTASDSLISDMLRGNFQTVFCATSVNNAFKKIWSSYFCIVVKPMGHRPEDFLEAMRANNSPHRTPY